MRRYLESIITAILVFCVFWNIAVFEKKVADLPGRNDTDVVRTEGRYASIRIALIRAKYNHGPIRFITKRDLEAKEPTADDEKQWGQAQYVMVPWILLWRSHSTGGQTMPDDPLYVIGDFWDGKPDGVPDGLKEVFDSGKGLVLYQKSL